ncbi:sigma-70 family RNA polymerase sigma factor [Fulvivirgaceae bacterium BMA10]|uniref:Sigma-70 family RNA polymerase sigma factor n=1 Tax=Splendidivirga corallicola TaxID=3051826 RepID=A0ABT8KHS9_9BACT|nr:sigma-70 family RNA polymerase sigma factor [Fulvivirgaceae bacterium BMA10]
MKAKKALEKDIIRAIKEGDEEEVYFLYNQYKNEFVQWSKHKFSIEKDDALDIFQDVVIAFYENVKLGKLVELNHTLKTYLFAIGKNLIRNRLKFDGKFADLQEGFDQLTISDDFEQKIFQKEQHKFVIDLLTKLGEPCNAILKLFYFDGFSMEAIAKTLNYKNKEVAKTQKARCIKALRNTIYQRYGKIETT